MKPFLVSDRSRIFGLHSLGFVVVTIAAYFSAVVTLSYAMNRFGTVRSAALIGLAVGYLLNGIFGYAWARKANSISRSVVYVATQIGIGGTLLFLATSPVIMFAMLPVVGQAVVLLPRRLMFAACGTMLAVLVVPLLIFSGWRPASVLGAFFLVGILFVVVITELAVKEQRAKREVERLVSELKDANDQLRQYADQVEELATLKERNRLAREIHDSLGHYLTVVIVQIEAAMAVFEKDREGSLDVLRKAQGLAQQGLADVRRSVVALRASPTEARSLIDSLNALIDECRVSGLQTEFQLVGTPRDLSPSAELALYRAAQEALTNVRRHSQASVATVTLNYSTDSVWLKVHDDGIGATELTKGFGLVGMHERVQNLGGEVRITTAANQGFTLEVNLPG
ncbi:MAG TPA: sensor histidine kinase [Pyrinomonadaceae bacterium]|nr:sensor histidine kinase [Pyrinomonadaceae bacterium]